MEEFCRCAKIVCTKAHTEVKPTKRLTLKEWRKQSREGGSIQNYTLVISHHICVLSSKQMQSDRNCHLQSKVYYLPVNTVKEIKCAY